MEKGKMKAICEDKKTQFHWSKQMFQELLKILADEIKRVIGRTTFSSLVPSLSQQIRYQKV